MFVIVLSHSDRSGIISTFGPFKTQKCAEAAINTMKMWPIQDGIKEIYQMLPFAYAVPDGE